MNPHAASVPNNRIPPGRHRGQTPACAFMALALVALLCGCGERRTPVETANAQNRLILSLGAEPQDLDPHRTSGVPAHRVQSALFEGLVVPHPDTLEPLPGVAERWELSADRRTYTFHLRANARWSNGQPVTAGDFAFSFRRILSPELGAQYAKMLFPIENARAYNNGEIENFGRVGVGVPDPHTLVIRLENPTPHFLKMLFHNSYLPVNRAAIAARGDPLSPGTYWTKPGQLVSNGPDTVEDWVVGDRMSVTRNPHYWNRADIAIDGITFKVITDQNVEERAFRAGQLHTTDSLLPAKIDVYRERGDPALVITPWLGTYYYLFNVTPMPAGTTGEPRAALLDVRVRRALALTVNREVITKAITRGGQETAHTFTPPGVNGYDAEPAFVHDPARARALLRDAGYPGGEGFPEIELLYNTSELHRPIAEAVQQMWKSQLGINVRLNNVSWKEVLARRERGEFQLLRAGWIADYPDPGNFLTNFLSYSGLNHSGWQHPRYDALIEAAAAEPTLDGRFARLREAEAILLGDAPLIPVYHYTRIHLKRPELKGWPTNRLAQINYRFLYLDTGAADANREGGAP